MILQLVFIALVAAVSAAPHEAEPPLKFNCQLSQDPGKQICRREGLTLSVYTTNALPIDLQIEKAELNALIKSWSPLEEKLIRPKRQFGFGGGLAGSNAAASANSFGAGYGGGGGYPGFGGGYPGGGGGFGGSNSYAASGSNAFGGGLGYGR